MNSVNEKRFCAGSHIFFDGIVPCSVGTARLLLQIVIEEMVS